MRHLVEPRELVLEEGLENRRVEGLLREFLEESIDTTENLRQDLVRRFLALRRLLGLLSVAFIELVLVADDSHAARFFPFGGLFV